MEADSLPLFSSNLHHPLNQLPLECQEYILGLTMCQFRETPMCSGGYDEEELRFYDGVLGNLIRTRDRFFLEGHTFKDYADFSSHWEHQGNIFRVLDKAYVFPKNGREPYLRTPAIKWHGMVASWSKSCDFTTSFNHIYADAPYTIIHANTKESAGIDANRLSDYLNCFNPFTADENEVIFPMKKEFVVKVYKHITPLHFKEIIENLFSTDQL